MKTNLKTFALVGALGLGAATLAVAQPGQQRGRHSVEQRVAHMRESLGLSDEQAARIETILKDAAAKRETGAEGRNREARAQRQEVRNQIDGVLTPEQREKRDKIASERQQKGGRRGGRRQR